MEFDRFTLCLLVRPAQCPELPPDRAARVQDDHMAHLATMHDEGILLAAGPLGGSDDPTVRGVAIFRGSPDDVRGMAEDDPAVAAGQLELRFFPWMVPAGAMYFQRTRFPRSMSDVD